MKKSYFFTILILISLSFISAVPGIPHQFYGEITVNGDLIKDNNIISAEINGEEYSTITKNGKYGFAPNSFFVEDPLGNNLGRTITFYVGGMYAGEFTFQNNGFTNLDFSLTTECSDGYCLGEETCSSCQEDCGVCDKPTIFIESPVQNKIYNDTKIDINIYSDQEISIWMYSINGETPIVFQPNITLTLLDGDYEIEILGMNSGYETGSEKVSFSVDLPYDYCGDGTCNGEETCSICAEDCGACPAPSSGGGGGGSSGGGGGGFISNILNKLIPLSNNETNETAIPETQEINIDLPNEVSEESETQEKTSSEERTGSIRFGDGITGAVVGITKTKLGKAISIIVLVLVILGIILMIVHLKNKNSNKNSLISEYSDNNSIENEFFH